MLGTIIDCMGDNKKINTAILYGTSFSDVQKEDVDIFVLLNSMNCISKDSFKELFELRDSLSKKTGKDIDLIPHTMDEVDNFLSPLYLPRYNPPLVYGKRIKGNVRIQQPPNISLTQKDILTSYLLLDRTILRRLACRETTPQENAVFINKVKKVPSNIINHLILDKKISFETVGEDAVDENFKLLSFVYPQFLPDYQSLKIVLESGLCSTRHPAVSRDLKAEVVSGIENLFFCFLTQNAQINVQNSNLNRLKNLNATEDKSYGN